MAAANVTLLHRYGGRQEELLPTKHNTRGSPVFSKSQDTLQSHCRGCGGGWNLPKLSLHTCSSEPAEISPLHVLQTTNQPAESHEDTKAPTQRAQKKRKGCFCCCLVLVMFPRAGSEVGGCFRVPPPPCVRPELRDEGGTPHYSWLYVTRFG